MASNFPPEQPSSGCPFMQTQPQNEVRSILGFATAAPGFIHGAAPSTAPSAAAAAAAAESSASTAETAAAAASASITGACHYADYLALTELLGAQDGASASKPGGKGMMHHEENLFVIVHQTFELWFKMVLVDVERCRDMLGELLVAAAGTGKTDMQTMMNGRLSLVLNYLRRMEQIIAHATNAFGIIETMHCADFLEFRDYLLPASGFQSVQFRKLERELGVQDAPRAQVNGVGVFTYLKPEEQEDLRRFAAGNKNVNELVNDLLAAVAVPSDFVDAYQQCARRVMVEQQTIIAKGNIEDQKVQRTIEGYCANLKAILDDPVGWCEGLTLESDAQRALFQRAVVACLFIYQYRQEPEYAVLASVLEQLVAVEESLLVWRSRHLHMAERMIGRRNGTGGSSGVGYLDITRRYRIFHALWLVRKLTIRSSALPPLKQLRSNGAAKLFL